jgi:flagellar transcriptional activator FlhC
MSLKTLSQYSVALEMLTLKARISIVAEAARLPPAILRKAFVEMHGISPPKGSQKVSPEFIFKSYQLQKEATLYLFFFHIETTTGLKFYRQSINAHKRYTSYISVVSKASPLLDFSDAWVMSKWAGSGELKLVRCRYCRSAKLITNKSQHHLCCVCRI